MRAVGVYSKERQREYFREVAGQLAAWMHIFRQPDPGQADELPGVSDESPGVSDESPSVSDESPSMCAELAALVEDRIRLDESIEVLERALRQGKGVVVMTMHIANVPFMLARLNQRVPITVLARHSKEPERQRAKEQWWRTTTIGHVALSQQSGGRIKLMADELGKGRVLAISPDMVRKRGDGTPVRFFDREVYLPSGAAVLAVKTGAPLVLMTPKPAGKNKCLTFHGPFEGNAKPGADGWEKAAVLERQQWFADGLESTLREHPSLWFFWGDKRWTRVFHDDPRYVCPWHQRAEAVDAGESGSGGDSPS